MLLIEKIKYIHWKNSKAKLKYVNLINSNSSSFISKEKFKKLFSWINYDIHVIIRFIPQIPKGFPLNIFYQLIWKHYQIFLRIVFKW